MHKLVLLMGCIVGLTAAGVMNARLPIRAELENLDVSNNIGTINIMRMSHQDLVRQKLLLDLLMDIEQPLRQEELLQMSHSIVLDPSKYIGDIDVEMMNIMQLWRTEGLLGKTETFSILNKDDVRQLVGIYRILVRSMDWDTLLRNACALRCRVNNVLLVNSLLLAIRDHPETQNLIVPALNEILPKLFYDDAIIKRVQSIGMINLTKPTESIRPSLMDMIGLSGRNRLMHGGMLNIIDRQQLWTPWQRMHLEIKRQRLETLSGGKRLVEDKIIVPLTETKNVEGLNLLTEDVGFKSFIVGIVNGLYEDEVESMEDDNVRPWQREDISIEQQSRESLERQRENDDLWGVEGHRSIVGDRDTINTVEPLQTDRLLHVGRRRTMLPRGNIVDGRRVVLEDEDEEDVVENRLKNVNIKEVPLNRIDGNRLLHINRRLLKQTPIMSQRERQTTVRDGRRVVIDDDMEDSVEMPMRSRGKEQMRTRQQDWDIENLPLTSTMDNQRLMHVGRRRLNRTPILNQRERLMNTMLKPVEMEMDEENMSNERMDTDSVMRRMWQDRRSSMVEDERRLDWGVKELPLNKMDKERLVHVSRRRMQQPTTMPIRGRNVRDGRLVERDDDILEERKQDIVGRLDRMVKELKERLLIAESIKQKLEAGIQMGQMGQDVKERIMGLNEMENKLKQRLMTADIIKRGLKDGVDEDSSAEIERLEWNIDNLPSVDVNSGRLLKVSRRRMIPGDLREDLGEERMLRINRKRQNKIRNLAAMDDMDTADMEIMPRTKIVDGRRVVEDESNMTLQDRLLTNTDTNRLLHINRRLVKQTPIMNQRERLLQTMQIPVRDGRRVVMDDDMDLDSAEMRMGVNIKNRLRGKDDVTIRSNPILREHQRLQDWDIENLPLTNVDSQRLLHVGRRRLAQTPILRQKEDLMVDEMAEDIENERILRLMRKRQNKLRNLGLMDDMETGMGMERRRMPRSLTIKDNLRSMMDTTKEAEILVHVLQQVIARINMERISLGMPKLNEPIMMESMLSGRMNNPRMLQERDQHWALRLNEMRMDGQRNRVLLGELNKFNDILLRLTKGDITNMESTKEIDRIIGMILKGRLGDVRVLEVMRSLLLQMMEVRGNVDDIADLGVLLNDPIAQGVTECLSKMIDLKRQELGSYGRQELELPGVKINDLVVDKLRTYVELVDIDMRNVLDTTEDIPTQKMVVIRQKRLNHKSFSIKIDVNSDIKQKVVVRVLLVSKIDGTGKLMSLDEQRLNSLVLDATVANLKPGRNMIKLRSQDIIWTSRDTTPLTEIYRKVLMALKGESIGVTQQIVIGQTCGFPQRLLLPRGRSQGMPMQLMTVITPVTEEDEILQRNSLDKIMCGIGLSTLTLDNLPLGFPLDRKIDNVEELMVPNILMKDVMIYHED